MPENVSAATAKAGTDDTLAAQWDTKTPKPQQFTEFYKLADSMTSALLTTMRPSLGPGPVSRAMAVAKRDGPDFYFIANATSQKFEDLKHSKTVQITFQDGAKTQNWASVTGTAEVTINSEHAGGKGEAHPDIKKLHGPSIAAWFADAGDGVHDGSATDPRMALIKVEPTYVAYWLSQVSVVGFAKEVGIAAMSGKVANTGVSRELLKADIEAQRKSV